MNRTILILGVSVAVAICYFIITQKKDNVSTPIHPSPPESHLITSGNGGLTHQNIQKRSTTVMNMAWAAYNNGYYDIALQEAQKELESNAEAQYLMGKLYAEGAGIAENTPRAINWYLKAASAGYVEAEFALGELFEQGGRNPSEQFRLPSNYPEARQWYQKAAQKGHAMSQLRLGQMLFIGAGGAVDKIKALAWIHSASSLGDAGAKISFEKLSQQMSSSEMAQVNAMQKEIYRLYPAASRNTEQSDGIGGMQ